MENLKHTSTIELCKEYSLLDREIDLLLQKIELKTEKYNLIRLELIRRIPTLIDEPEFQEKELIVPQEPPLKK